MCAWKGSRREIIEKQICVQLGTSWHVIYIIFRLSLYQIDNLDDNNILADFFHMVGIKNKLKKSILIDFSFDPIIKCIEAV